MNTKGQGALEYLLIIGAAVIIAVIVIVVMMGMAEEGTAAADTADTNAAYSDGLAMATCADECTNAIDMYDNSSKTYTSCAVDFSNIC